MISKLFQTTISSEINKGLEELRKNEVFLESEIKKRDDQYNKVPKIIRKIVEFNK